jgi:hypothetical protein
MVQRCLSVWQSFISETFGPRNRGIDVSNVWDTCAYGVGSTDKQEPTSKSGKKGARDGRSRPPILLACADIGDTTSDHPGCENEMPGLLPAVDWSLKQLEQEKAGTVSTERR